MMQKILCDLQIACCNKADLPTPALFRRWLEQALSPSPTSAEVTIRLVDENESCYLNSHYRGKQHATNVLAFPNESLVTLTPPLLGDLVICRQVVEREACAQHIPLMAHWAHMVVHGSLHLLGYRHDNNQEAKRMESLESAILKKLGYADPYLTDNQKE